MEGLFSMGLTPSSSLGRQRENKVSAKGHNPLQELKLGRRKVLSVLLFFLFLIMFVQS